MFDFPSLYGKNLHTWHYESATQCDWLVNSLHGPFPGPPNRLTHDDTKSLGQVLEVSHDNAAEHDDRPAEVRDRKKGP